MPVPSALIRPLWSRSTDARLGGLSLAREAGLLLAWDESRTLYLWDQNGALQAREAIVPTPVAAAISDDGSRVVVAGKEGEVWLLNGRLQLQFDFRVIARPQAVALEPLGRFFAVADRDRRTCIYPASSRLSARFETPRPLRHLLFVPERTLLLGAAEFGFVGGFDLAGAGVWKDVFVSHIGSLAHASRGQMTVLSCYSDGLRRYDGNGQTVLPHLAPESCRLAAVNDDGTRVFAATETGKLLLLSADGAPLGEFATGEPAHSLVLGALGDFAAYGLARGEVVALEIQL